jgi:hypothetical protein
MTALWIVRLSGKWERSAGELAFVAGAVLVEPFAGVGEALAAVGSASHAVGVLVVLPVVLPVADLADVPCASFIEREVAAAGAGIRTATRRQNDVDERAFGTHQVSMVAVACSAKPFSSRRVVA